MVQTPKVLHLRDAPAKLAKGKDKKQPLATSSTRPFECAELAEGKAPVIVTLQSPYTVPIRHTYCVPQVHVPAFMKILLCNLPTLVGWDKLQLLLSWDVSASLWTE